MWSGHTRRTSIFCGANIHNLLLLGRCVPKKWSASDSKAQESLPFLQLVLGWGLLGGFWLTLHPEHPPGWSYWTHGFTEASNGKERGCIHSCLPLLLGMKDAELSTLMMVMSVLWLGQWVVKQGFIWSLEKFYKAASHFHPHNQHHFIDVKTETWRRKQGGQRHRFSRWACLTSMPVCVCARFCEVLCSFNLPRVTPVSLTSLLSLGVHLFFSLLSEAACFLLLPGLHTSVVWLGSRGSQLVGILWEAWQDAERAFKWDEWQRPSY